MDERRRNELRCFFAGMYLAGVVSNSPEGNAPADVAELSFDYAEAMLKEADKRENRK
jgi:hypothetical protein